MTLPALLARFTAAAEAGDGPAFGACFSEDGIYRDVFYGDFAGRAEIARMLEQVFHRDGEAFRWDMPEPVSDGRLAYVRYLFSYRSKLPEFAGRRAAFEGVAILRLRDGLIEDYHEVANALPGLAAMGFPEPRLARLAARMGRELMARPEMARHR